MPVFGATIYRIKKPLCNRLGLNVRLHMGSVLRERIKFE